MREPTQLITLHRPIRGVTRTIIMRPNGQVVMPVRQEHGLATWLLEPGRYIAVTIYRPKWQRLYEVTVQCLELNNGERYVLSEAVFHSMRLSRSAIHEWVTACGGQ
jgi:hypothetical protein